MELTYQLLADLTGVSAFLAANDWPFHAGGLLPERSAQRYVDDDVRSHWIVRGDQRIGLIRVDDLSDGPMIDLRIAATQRGRGVGTVAVRWLAADVFTQTEASRIEGTTRVDNAAMRRAFLRAGWVKEAHYRRAWPTPDGALDAVGYAILRNDWTTGIATPVNFDDKPR